MNKEQLIEYFNLYNKFQKNMNMQFTNEQLNLINEVHKEAQNNQELATLLANNSISTEEERMTALNNYLKEQDKYMINGPMNTNYNEEQITTSDKIDTQYIENEQYNSLQSNYEDKPQIQEFNQLSEEMQQQIKQYYEYPELLEMLPEEEKQIWKNSVELYKQKLEKDEYNLENKPKQYVLKKEEKQSGFADVLLLSLITGFLGGVLTTLTTILLTK